MTRALALLLLCPAAMAGTTYTNVQGRYEARNAAGVMLSAHDTLEQCIAVLPLPTAPGKVRLGTCKLVYHIDGELNCNDAQRPPLATFTVTDDNATVYRGPYCAPGETCALPAGWELERNVTTFTDVGAVRINADDTVDLYKLTNPNQYPRCWAWEWQHQGEPVALRSGADGADDDDLPDVDADGHGTGPVFTSTAADFFKPPLDDGAEDGNGLGVSDPPWGTP